MFPSALYKLLQGTVYSSLTPKGILRRGGRGKEVPQPTPSHPEEVDEEIEREKKKRKKKNKK